MTVLEVERLTVRYGSLTIVRDLSFRVREGEWLMIAGPNGAGKSTVLNALTQGAPYTGTVRVLSRDVRSQKPRELARNVGVLTQGHSVGYAFTVEEIVRMGRYAYAPGVFSARSDADGEAVARALAQTGMTALAGQSVLTLSGGELQRAFLAQLLAQQPRLLLLDEPTNHLDLVYQKEMFGLIAAWLAQPGRAVVSVVHDLSLARAYGTHALLLDRGQAVAQGAVAEVFTPARLNAVYQMDVYGWMRNMLSQWKE